MKNNHDRELIRLFKRSRLENGGKRSVRAVQQFSTRAFNLALQQSHPSLHALGLALLRSDR